MHNLILSPIDPEKLINSISEKVIANLLNAITKQEQPKEYLTRQQVAQMFGVDISTVHNWCKSKKLNPLGLGSRVYFLRSEVEASLKPLNV